ncbi:MAG: hypothetical protein HGB31_05145 [Erysipelotrichaceae bacterium]|nr:hypothetical protein [Erysipelotrichaceae bacterium]
MELDNLKIVDTATSNMIPICPASLRNWIIGTLIGLMLAIGNILIPYLINNTFMSAQEVVHYLGLTVLGEIHFTK